MAALFSLVFSLSVHLAASLVTSLPNAGHTLFQDLNVTSVPLANLTALLNLTTSRPSLAHGYGPSINYDVPGSSVSLRCWNLDYEEKRDDNKVAELLNKVQAEFDNVADRYKFVEDTHPTGTLQYYSEDPDGSYIAFAVELPTILGPHERMEYGQLSDAITGLKYLVEAYPKAYLLCRIEDEYHQGLVHLGEMTVTWYPGENVLSLKQENSRNG